MERKQTNKLLSKIVKRTRKVKKQRHWAKTRGGNWMTINDETKRCWTRGLTLFQVEWKRFGRGSANGKRDLGVLLPHRVDTA